jgi:hypothetical protein
MGKTFRADARNPKWRRAKMDREKQKNGGQRTAENDDEQTRRDEKNGLYGGAEDIIRLRPDNISYL